MARILMACNHIRKRTNAPHSARKYRYGMNENIANKERIDAQEKQKKGAKHRRG
jgi:hypothetical protein